MYIVRTMYIIHSCKDVNEDTVVNKSMVVTMDPYPDWIRIQLGQIRNPDPYPGSKKMSSKLLIFYQEP